MTNETKQPVLKRVVEKHTITVVLAVLSAFTAIANLWAISKLAPVTQDIAVVTTRVEAIESKTDTIVPRTEYSFTITAVTDLIQEWKHDTEDRLKRIENKIDRL